jgi:hypothetical protein
LTTIVYVAAPVLVNVLGTGVQLVEASCSMPLGWLMVTGALKANVTVNGSLASSPALLLIVSVGIAGVSVTPPLLPPPHALSNPTAAKPSHTVIRRSQVVNMLKNGFEIRVMDGLMAFWMISGVMKGV